VPSWRITGQSEQTQIQAGGLPVKGVQVFFQTTAGHTGSVFVPYTSYTAAGVAAAVSERAALMDEVGSLTGPPTGG